MLGSSFLRAPPSPGEVHLWLLDPSKVDDPVLLDVYSTFLNDEEREIVGQGASEEARKERLLTRVLARTTLARYCGGLLDPSQIEFGCNKHGKPSIMGPADLLRGGAGTTLSSLQFNLSHTKSLIACGVANKAQVGVDVEETSRLLKTDVLKLASRKFSAAEAANLAKMECLQARHSRFVELWTLKESFVKAIGKGIAAAPLSGFSFDLRPQPELARHLQTVAGLPSDPNPLRIGLSFHDDSMTGEGKYGPDPATWRFFLVRPSPHHTLALCVQKTEGKLRSRKAATGLPRLIGSLAWRSSPERLIKSGDCAIEGR